MRYKIEYLNHHTTFVHVRQPFQSFINSHACISQSRLDDLLRNHGCELEIVPGTRFIAEIFLYSKSKDTKEFIGSIVATQKGKVIFLFNYNSDSAHNKFDIEFFNLMFNEMDAIARKLEEEKVRPEESSF